MTWTADLANDPQKDYALCIELWNDDDHIASIERSAEGQVVLNVHRGAVLPAAWLATLLAQAEVDLVPQSGDGS